MTTARDADGAPPGRGAGAAALAAAGLAFLGMQLVLGHLRPGMLGPGILDPDSYSRLLRVEQLLTGGGWYDGSVAWANAPFGDTLHWTRAYDLLVSGLAVPLSLVMGLRPAILLAGSLLPVALGLATVLAIAWAARHHLGPRTTALLGLLAGVQPTLPQVFRSGYVDHHSLLIFLFALGWAGTLGVCDGRRRAPLLAGTAAGLALWTSVESLAWTAAVAAALGLLWLLEGGGGQARDLALMLAAAATAALAALAIERHPATWRLVEMDRISVAQVSLLVALGAAWALVAQAEHRAPAASTRRRWTTAAAAFGAPAAAAALAFPRLLRGPTADVDPRVMRLLFENNGEFVAFAAQDLLYLGMFAAAAGPAIVAAIVCVVLVRQGERIEKRIALATLVLLAVFLPLTLYQWRWVRYLNVLALLPWALLIHGVWRRLSAGTAWRRWLRVPAALALATAHLVAAVALARLDLARVQGSPRARAASPPAATRPGPPPGPVPPGACSYAGLGPVLAAAAGRDAGELVVMTPMYDGPQLVWEAGVRVVGTPYHRNAAGILDTDAALAGTDEETARRVLDERGVDFVVVCPGGSSLVGMARSYPGSLAARLARGEVPSWLEPVAAPGGPDRAVAAFRVRHGIGE